MEKKIQKRERSEQKESKLRRNKTSINLFCRHPVPSLQLKKENAHHSLKIKYHILKVKITAWKVTIVNSWNFAPNHSFARTQTVSHAHHQQKLDELHKYLPINNNHFKQQQQQQHGWQWLKWQHQHGKQQQQQQSTTTKNNNTTWLEEFNNTINRVNNNKNKKQQHQLVGRVLNNITINKVNNNKKTTWLAEWVVPASCLQPTSDFKASIWRWSTIVSQSRLSPSFETRYV